MIFQQNRLQPLSGNSIGWQFIFGVILLSLMMYSCGASKKSSTTRSKTKTRVTKDKIETKVTKDKVVRMDTVQWKKDSDKPIITDEDEVMSPILDVVSVMKDEYNITYCIPFKSKNFHSDQPELGSRENRFINFYAGVKMAFEDLEKEGARLKVNVLDTDYSASQFQELLSTETLKNTDILVGPYKKESVKRAAVWGKENKKTVLSPWISSSSITEDNPYYIQTKPGLIKHYETMLYHAKQNCNEDELVLVVKKGDVSKMRYFDKVNKTIGGDSEKPGYTIMELETDSLTYADTAFDSTIFVNPPLRKVFMVPYSSGKDAGFVYDFLRRLQVEKRECEVTVYGMYRWIDFQDEMLEIMNVMDVKLTISNLVNPVNSEVIRFKHRFLRTYGAFPTDDAYEGYDLTVYIGTMLKKYGDKFHVALKDEAPLGYIQTVFDLLPEMNEDEKVDYFENQFIDLIEFENYQFKRTQ